MHLLVPEIEGVGSFAEESLKAREGLKLSALQTIWGFGVTTDSVVVIAISASDFFLSEACQLFKCGPVALVEVCS